MHYVALSLLVLSAPPAEDVAVRVSQQEVRLESETEFLSVRMIDERTHVEIRRLKQVQDDPEIETDGTKVRVTWRDCQVDVTNARCTFSDVATEGFRSDVTFWTDARDKTQRELDETETTENELKTATLQKSIKRLNGRIEEKRENLERYLKDEPLKLGKPTHARKSRVVKWGVTHHGKTVATIEARR